MISDVKKYYLFVCDMLHMDESVSIGARVPSWGNEELLKIAKEQGLDRSDIIRDALRSYVDALNARRCPECDTVNDPDSRYCKNCGRGLTVSKEEELNELIEGLDVDHDTLIQTLRQLKKNKI